jgi:hypothetical protein
MNTDRQEQKVDSFTRGSQLYAHKFNMMVQGTRNCCKVGFLASVCWILFRCYQKLTFASIYYFGWYLWACLKVEIGSVFYSGKQISLTLYDIITKKYVLLSANKFVDSFWLKTKSGRTLIFFLDWLSCSAIFELVAVFCLGLTIAYVFFVMQGKKSSTKNKVRGGDIVSSQEITKMLQKAKMASSITFNKMPIPKDSQRQHILVSGTTGSGKTNFVNELVPQIRKSGEKAIIVDINGSFVSQFFDPEQDILLNPLDERSAKWLPWADCVIDSDYDAIIEAIVGESLSSDPFWDNSCKSVVREALWKLRHTRDIKELLEILWPNRRKKVTTNGIEKAHLLNRIKSDELVLLEPTCAL